MDEAGKYIKTVVKSRQIVFYLVTEQDLNSFKSNSVLADIFAVLTSLAVGGIFSVQLTKATGIQLQPEVINILDLLLYFCIFVALIFGILTGYYYIKSFIAIRKIKESGEVKTLKSHVPQESDPFTSTTKEDEKLEIINATYGTNNANVDVTEELRKKVKNNKLQTIASNDIKCDPDYGVEKKLTIEYKINGISITKEYKEHDRISLP